MPPPLSPLRRFGSVDPFLEGTAWDHRMGRPLVNGQFLRALLLHSQFDAFDFFLPDVAYVKRWQRRLASLVPDGAVRAKVRAFPLTALRAQLQRQSYDVFHQGDCTYFLPHLVALRQADAQLNFCVTGVTHSLDGLHDRFVSLGHAQLQAHDGLVCTSRAAAAVVRKKMAEVARHWGSPLPPVHLATIPLGVDPAAFAESDSPSLSQSQARRALGLPPEGLLVLSLGRLSLRSKNDWAPIFEMLAPLHAAGTLGSARFVLAGGCSGDGRALLSQLRRRYGLCDRVILLANVPAAKKAALLRAADIFLAPVDNTQETFGLCILEALAAGLPIVAADYDGYRDSLRHGQDGLLVPTLGSANLPTCMQGTLGLLDPSLTRLLAAQMTAIDLSKLQEALLALLHDAPLRRQLGQAAQQRAADFAWPKIVAAYEAFWCHLAAQRPPQAAADPAPLRRLGGEDLAAFAGHVAHQLHPCDRLRCTARGQALRRDADLVTRYADVQPLLPPAIEGALLSAAEGAGTTLQALRGIGMQAGAASLGDVDFILLWLLKHGALQWQAAAVSAAPDAPGDQSGAA